ncbi:5370_t:CDS:2 [Dentiscutata erythropus]|uniref:5370_t:CDS:1 n=1 Tax=Dentiscutata erythropus TaxID=1348616 RepID=A0A9N9I2Z6_9GLOM|nr:5370_t:CDS:2 [Dentiscutata erythropus]
MQINWKKLFQDWVLYKNTIIELRLALRNLYQKFRFWSRSTNPNTDKASLMMLYTLGFLNPIPKHFKNNTKTFWQCFKNSLEVNLCGDNGKCRILSVIANVFSYEKINENFKISNNAIIAARKHAHVCGPGEELKTNL